MKMFQNQTKNTEQPAATHPAGNYMFKVNNRNARTPCSSVSIVNFELVNPGWADIRREHF